MNSKSIGGLAPYGSYESPQRSIKQSQSGSVEQQRQQEKVRSPLQYAGGLISSNAVPISNFSSVARNQQRASGQTNSLPAFRDEQMLLMQKPTRQTPLEQRAKQIMPILTLKRLRKIQALVRGFLTRRITYPPLLRQHRLCEAVYDSIRRRVTDRLVTEVALEVITFNKYNDNIQLYSPQSTAIFAVADNILETVIAGISRGIVTDAIGEISRNITPVQKTMSPLVTFNMRDPVDVLAYDMFLREIAMVKRPIAQQIISEMVDEIRLETQIKQHFIDSILKKLYRQIVSETIEEYGVHDIAQQLIDSQIKKATQAVVNYEYEKALQPLEKKARKDFNKDFLTLLISQTLLEIAAEDDLQPNAANLPAQPPNDPSA